MPGFDPMNQYIGLNTPLDKMFHDAEVFGPQGKSANAMDANYGGANFAREVVRSGAYAGDTASPNEHFDDN